MIWAWYTIAAGIITHHLAALMRRKTMTDTPSIADLRERRQRAREATQQHLNNTKATLHRMGYDVVPKSRRAGRWVGYIMLAALGALSTAALIGAMGLAVWATRWLVGML